MNDRSLNQTSLNNPASPAVPPEPSAQPSSPSVLSKSDRSTPQLSAQSNRFRIFFILSIIFSVVAIAPNLLTWILPSISGAYYIIQYTSIISSILAQTFAILALEQYFYFYNAAVPKKSSYIMVLFIASILLGFFSSIAYASIIIFIIYCNLISRSYHQARNTPLLLKRSAILSLVFGIIVFAGFAIPAMMQYVIKDSASAQGFSMLLYLIYVPFYALGRIEAMVPVLVGFGLLVQYRKAQFPTSSRNLIILIISLILVLSPVLFTVSSRPLVSVNNIDSSDSSTYYNSQSDYGSSADLTENSSSINSSSDSAPTDNSSSDIPNKLDYPVIFFRYTQQT